MPVAIDPADRKILIVAGAVLVLLIVASALLMPPGEQAGQGFPSTYSSASDGARAAYLLLKDLGYEVERWERPPTELPAEATGSVLIIADPSMAPGAREAESVRRFVESGGRVLFTGAGVRMFFRNASAAEQPLEIEWKKFSARLPSAFTRGAEQIAMAPSASWTGDTGQFTLYGEKDFAVVVTWRLGKGRVIWWAAPTPLSNAGISRPGNLTLFLNSVAALFEEDAAHAGPARIYWDEYFHGQRSSLWSYFRRTPVPWGLAQLGVLALAVFWTFGRRSGPVFVPAAVSRLSPLEFVDTLGSLYQRAGAAPAAVRVAYQRFRNLLTRRLGLPLAAPNAALEQGVRARLGWKETGLSDTLQRAERASRSAQLAGAEALEIVQALERCEERLGLRPRREQEKR
jgi:hypothetical protein